MLISSNSKEWKNASYHLSSKVCGLIIHICKEVDKKKFIDLLKLIKTSSFSANNWKFRSVNL